MSAREFEGHEKLIAQLRAGTLDAPEHLHRRILVTRSARSHRLSIPRGRRLVLVLPVAAALAVGAALIHGAFNSGTNANLEPTLAAGLAPVHGSASKPEITNHVRSAEKKVTAAGPTFGQALQPYKAPVPNTPSNLDQLGSNFSAAGANPGSVQAWSSVSIPTNRLVHADASLQVVVPSHDALTRATNRAAQIVAQLGGYAQNIQYQTSRKGDGYAYLDLRIPVGKAETAIGRLGALGKLVSQQVSTQDLQQTFAKQSNTIGTLKRAIAVYKQALSSGSVTGAQRVEVQIRLSNAEHALASTRKARSHTLSSGATADVQLQLTTNQHAFAVVPHKSGRLGRLLGNAADFLGLEGVIVLYALIVAGPIVLIGALGWWLTRERRRRDERRLLASA